MSGAGYLALAEASRADSNAAGAINAANQARWRAEEARDRAVKEKDELFFKAQAQIHFVRAVDAARVEVIKLMSKEIAKFDPDHPFADTLSEWALRRELYSDKLKDPAVIKLTYPEGYLNHRVLLDEGADFLGVADGLPGFPDPRTPEERRQDVLARQEKFNAEQMVDIPLLEKRLASRQQDVAQLHAARDEDDQKGFFGKLNKKKRKELEDKIEDLEWDVLELKCAIKRVPELIEKRAKEQAQYNRMIELTGIMKEAGLIPENKYHVPRSIREQAERARLEVERAKLRQEEAILNAQLKELYELGVVRLAELEAVYPGMAKKEGVDPNSIFDQDKLIALFEENIKVQKELLKSIMKDEEGGGFLGLGKLNPEERKHLEERIEKRQARIDFLQAALYMNNERIFDGTPYNFPSDKFPSFSGRPAPKG